MKLRIAIAAFLIVIAVALPLVGVIKKGTPWSYRGHKAVLLEATGNVEITASEARVARDGLAESALKPAPGLFLDAGDEVRAGRYSEARLRLPTGDALLGDDARVSVAEKGIVLHRGLVEVALPRGTTPFEISVPFVDTRVTVRPGGDGGGARLLADGTRDLHVFVKSGSAEATAAGDKNAESGQIVVVDASRTPRIEEVVPLAPTSTCEGKKLTVQVPAGTQVFAAQKLAYPEDGRVVVDLKDTKSSVPVLARDVTGKAWLGSVPCVAAKPK